MVQTPVRTTQLSTLSSTPIFTPELAIRHDWTTAEIQALLDLPLMDLVYQAQTVHRQFQPHNEIQLATLLSVKTGGCAENCAYCPQSAHYDTTVDPATAMSVETVLESAKKAQELGASRFCMGWAWREIRDGAMFDDMVVHGAWGQRSGDGSLRDGWDAPAPSGQAISRCWLNGV